MMKNRFMAVLMAFGIVLAGLVALPVTASGPVQPVSQAQASFEDVQNSLSSTRNISVRIWPKNQGYYFDRIVGANSGVNAGTDRISSYYIPRYVCASVNRGGVNIGVKKGPVRIGLAQAERIHVYAYRC